MEAFYEQQDGGGGLLAIGAFEIPILDDRDGRVMRTSHVICS
jgi:hypothetical protein